MAPKSSWREWLTLGRIVPLLTVLAAVTGNVLDWFKVIDMTIAENLMLATIALLAFDGLTERVRVLSRIQGALERLDRPSAVFSDLAVPHSHLPPLEERLVAAKGLWVSGTAMPVLTTVYENVIVSKAKNGLSFHFLLAVPDPPFEGEIAGGIYPDSPNSVERMRSAGADAIVRLKSIQARTPVGTVEIRKLRKHLLLQSLLVIDGDEATAEVQVYLYTHLGDPPGVFRLKAATDPMWCEFFLREFRLLWDAAEEVP